MSIVDLLVGLDTPKLVIPYDFSVKKLFKLILFKNLLFYMYFFSI
jgi:hypothetical protein